MNKPLFVPDLDALKRKLADPPPLLAKCYARFQDRVGRDGDFRRHNIFLAALLEFVEGLRHAGFAPSLLHLW